MSDAARRASIERCLAAGDVASAAREAEAALAAGDITVMYLNLAAWRREEEADFAGARALLDRARALAPGDASIETALGTVLRKEGRFAEAIAAFDRVLANHPAYPVAWLERGFAGEAAGDHRGARESYARAAALDPALGPAHAGMAWIAAIEGDAARVRDHAARALAIDPGDATATCALARSEIAAGAADRAERRLAPLRACPALDPNRRMIVAQLYGDALDRLNRADAAWEAYADANRAFLGTPAARAVAAGQGVDHSRYVSRLAERLGAVDRAAWRRAPPAPAAPSEAPPRHVFLLGYPRSGTTLVETILATADDVAALEEKPTTIDADRAFLLDDGGLDRLAALEPAAAAPLVAAYWRRVGQAGAAVPAGTFVDMDPLKGVKLPLIAALFPQARIVVMRRDPRDVVLSCLRTAFVATAASLEFVDPVRAARHYDAVMRMTESCLATFPLARHVMRYEALVADFDAQTRALCDFVGIRWTPALRDFAATARARGVSTASASQVRRGLYDGAGGWRRYARQLAPAMPILAPWIERFGYEA